MDDFINRMFTQRFYHSGILYEFKWAKRQNLIRNMPNSLSSPLLLFFDQISKREIPQDLFNDKNVTRCSKFRIKGLKRGIRQKIVEILIEKDLIQPFNMNNYHISRIHTSLVNLLKETDKIYNEILENKLDYNPSHEEVLNRILLTNEQAISIETPVWTRKQSTLSDFMNMNPLQFTCKQSITGHIDLLMYEPQKHTLIVCDYKPEGYFLRSMPQVATYGLLLKRILNVKEVKCLSFRKEEAWLYDPELIRTDIENLLKNHGNPPLNWRKILKNI